MAAAAVAAAGVGWVVLASLAIWTSLDDAQRDAAGAALAPAGPLFALALVVLAALMAALVRWAWAAYPGVALRLSEQVRDAHAVDADPRIEPRGGPEMRTLASAVAALAAEHRALRRSLDERIAESNARLQEQKNRLAALMAQLAQSVLVCNRDGTILLYNARATALLASPDGASPVGLGRSIFGVVDRELVVHALERIGDRLAQGEVEPVVQFVTARGERLLRGQVSPVMDAGDAPGGFVMVLSDITRIIESGSRRDFLLQQMTEHTRASLGNIRAAVETVQLFPEMEADRRQRFVEVIRAEAERLSEKLEQSLARNPEPLRAPWPLEDMLAADLVAALRRTVESNLGLHVSRVVAEPRLWLSVDSYAIVQALSHVALQVASRFGVREIAIEAAAAGRLAQLSLQWRGRAMDPGLVGEWESQPFAVGGRGRGPTLRDVLERHGAEIWARAHALADGDALNRVCVELPVAEPEHAAPTAGAAPGRPVYFDFDLFAQPRPSPELDDRPLASLSCTVFDTETTGLSPSEGDQIVSIGAVRIVNGRVLDHETFERLVNPGRPVKREALEVHGLSDAMLAGQPGIEEVLPAFHRFAHDTVLVAHNAAFDMRFLQLSEGRTGVRFVQPVLDTLLLSALAHPGHADAEHRLEQIAARLGVPVVGRHTALGDAMVTAEVFLKLLPLLAAQGIRTLREAREASRKTAYAKLEY